MFISIGLDNNNPIISHSLDSKSWKNTKIIGSKFSFFDIVYGDKKFIALANDSRNSLILTSIDGMIWKEKYIDKSLSNVGFCD